ncbi:MAG: hypothetical protein IJE05_01650 [Clostridia bacterium]|nr:hypothetical protein [Clostridia bacterium]
MKRNGVNYCKRIVIVGILCIILILTSTNVIMASSGTTSVMPEDNQYFELRATEVNAVEGQNKQVIMELWGNNIEFKRI